MKFTNRDIELLNFIIAVVIRYCEPCAFSMAGNLLNLMTFYGLLRHYVPRNVE